ncbi:hypothetical protein [Antarctobacter sp.]|uniref:hypothetical protein n=1 Tax=Antarctobacter sp. TaxID=1872577 RepID=UPI002B267DB3|nr:hypothetical protein [Antarctobacter sp.]
MQVIIPPTHTAPQVTGHPQGLPGDQAKPDAQTKIKPIADARNPEARLNDGLAPTKFWRAANGEPDPSTNAPPPSIMQITISRMLDAQSADFGSREPPAETSERTETADADKPPKPEPVTSTVRPDNDDQSAEPNDPRSSVLSTLP